MLAEILPVNEMNTKIWQNLHVSRGYRGKPCFPELFLSVWFTMKSIRWFTLRRICLLTLFFSASLVGNFAVAQDCCVCEIGKDPEHQQGFFELGCRLWLGEQKGCASKVTVVQGTDYRSLDFNRCSPQGRIRLGYVGHWRDSWQSIFYLRYRVVPLARERRQSVIVDNTACLAMKEPERVLESLRQERLPPGLFIHFRGNQVESVGKWDKIFGRSINVWAEARTDHADVIFPACRDFEDKACFSGNQLEDRPRCRSAQGELITLRCCQKEDLYSEGGAMNSNSYFWKKVQDCQGGKFQD
jgi:hypothetical protein